MVDSVNPQVDVSGVAPEGHDQAMIAKVDEIEKFLQQRQQEEKPPQQKIAGKFNSYDELEKAYRELEKRLGGNQEQPKGSGENLTEDEALKRVEQANLDLSAMSDYFAQNGALSEDHYAALEKAGIPRTYVDSYIDGVTAKFESDRNALMGKVGGEEQFNSMIAWAKANMSKAEIDAYNRAVESNDLTVVENAILGLAYRYQQEVGRDPKLLGGGNAAGAGFQSVAQLIEAMKDPRYEKDPAYRRDIEQRLARSNIM
jgi:vacuolar-type H+-ATPase subunit I/STV1